MKLLRVRGNIAAIAAIAAVLAGAGAAGTISSSSVSAASPPDSTCNQRFTVGFIPKQTADPFFVAADKGAQEAAKQLNLQVIYKGPVNLDPAGQTQVITTFTNEHLNAITVSADDADALVPALKKAAAAGIRVSSWNAQVTGPFFFMGNPPPSALAKALVEEMVSSVGPDAKILVMTSTLQAPNQNAWLAAVQDYVHTHYPHLVIEKILPGQSDTSLSFNIAKSWLQAHPETKGILTVDGSELAGAAQAVRALGLKGKVTLVGIGVPSQNGPDLLNGTVKAVVLWSPVDQGYATMYMVHAQLCRTLKPGQKTLYAGRLGYLQFTSPYDITLGKPTIFTEENVNNYHF
jgi:rhamnose transport system substrate-binding protein